MSSTPYQLGIPVYDNPVYALGCDNFVLEGRSIGHCIKMLNKLKEKTKKSKFIQYYPIGIRPAHPVPVARYFMEVEVIDDKELYRNAVSLYTPFGYGKLD